MYSGLLARSTDMSPAHRAGLRSHVEQYERHLLHLNAWSVEGRLLQLAQQPMMTSASAPGNAGSAVSSTAGSQSENTTPTGPPLPRSVAQLCPAAYATQFPPQPTQIKRSSTAPGAAASAPPQLKRSSTAPGAAASAPLQTSPCCAAISMPGSMPAVVPASASCAIPTALALPMQSSRKRHNPQHPSQELNPSMPAPFCGLSSVQPQLLNAPGLLSDITEANSHSLAAILTASGAAPAPMFPYGTSLPPSPPSPPPKDDDGRGGAKTPITVSDFDSEASGLDDSHESIVLPTSPGAADGAPPYTVRTVPLAVVGSPLRLALPFKSAMAVRSSRSFWLTSTIDVVTAVEIVVLVLICMVNEVCAERTEAYLPGHVCTSMLLACILLSASSALPASPQHRKRLLSIKIQIWCGCMVVVPMLFIVDDIIRTPEQVAARLQMVPGIAESIAFSYFSMGIVHGALPLTSKVAYGFLALSMLIISGRAINLYAITGEEKLPLLGASIAIVAGCAGVAASRMGGCMVSSSARSGCR
jgi:hypothetical protein